MLANKLLGAAKAVTPAANYVDDVFSTWLYPGNGIAQTINNGIALGDDYGGSVYFNGGTSTALTCSSATAFDFGTGDFTIECWAYISSYIGAFTMICATEGVNQYWGFGSIGSGGMSMYAGSSGTDIYSGSGSTPGLNQWNHLVWQRSSGVASMYLNGTRVYNAAYTANFGSTATGFRIGQSASYADYYVNGYISNLRVVKGTGVYSGSTITVPTSPLTAISGTSLLTCQAPNATADNSSSPLTITVTDAIAQNGGGAFTDSTANKGGLVWIRNRSTVSNHILVDTARGATFNISSNLTSGQSTESAGLTSFNSNGFSLGALGAVNNSGSNTYASWTFRKQEKFFDVVTYTGNGANRTIAHNLGSEPGCIIVKRTDATVNWAVYHRSQTSAANGMSLNTGSPESSQTTFWNSTAPTSTVFSVGTSGSTNANGGTYVAYLFAHNAGGFGATGNDNVISCGSYTGNGSTTGTTITLGYEPQWILIKRLAGGNGGWILHDTMRGLPTGGNSPFLLANATDTENNTANFVDVNATGFQLKTISSSYNASGSTYVYIAIRRPMKPPTSGTQVYEGTAYTGNGTAERQIGSSVLLDLLLLSCRTADSTSWSTYAHYIYDRLRGDDLSLSTTSTAAEVPGWTTFMDFDKNIGWDTSSATGTAQNYFNRSSSTFVSYVFKRAPGFMDVVCYTGTGANRTITHNLGVAPELMIVKVRSGTTNDWWVYDAATGNTKYQALNTTAAPVTSSTAWNNTTPTSSVFTVGTGAGVNGSTFPYVAYLFASISGVSKVGSYTGTGTTQTINCGFTAGARFVMIKRTDSTGDWYVWDTARGIVSGNDPRLSLNTTAAEVTTDDSIDPDNSGFIVNQVAATNINVNAATYIFLAIA